MKNKSAHSFIGLIIVVIVSCTKDDNCTGIDRIGGQLLP